MNKPEGAAPCTEAEWQLTRNKKLEELLESAVNTLPENINVIIAVSFLGNEQQHCQTTIGHNASVIAMAYQCRSMVAMTLATWQQNEELEPVRGEMLAGLKMALGYLAAITGQEAGAQAPAPAAALH